ncbi:MAG: type II secretion system protein [Phycisphaerae bacterium]
MTAIRHRSPKGFTLVEILIVVIILGILAAIVIPQFTNASEDARKSSLTSQLQTLRSQVELYKLQHRDEYPTDDGLVSGAWDWDKMIQTTDEDGDTSGTGFGPYLQALPVNNLNGNTTMEYIATAGTPAAGTGWVIDVDGKIFASGKTDTNWFNEGTGSDAATKPGS